MDIKKILLAAFCFFFFVAATTLFFFDPPSLYTKYYRLRGWELDENPSADSLNQNWVDVDSLLNELIVFTDTNQMKIENDTLKFSQDFIQNILDSAFVVTDTLIVEADSIIFADFIPQNGDTVTHKQGRVFYDTRTRSFTVLDDIIGTSLQVGQEFIVRVVNNDTDTLKDGMVCSYAGWNGQFAYAVKANSKSDSLSTILAVATHDIAPGDSGKLTVFGAIGKLNTSMYNEGDVIYVDTLDGQWTTNKPPAKYNQSPFGFILRSDASDGIIYAYTGLIPSISRSTSTNYISSGATSIATNTTPVQITNGAFNLFSLDENVSYDIVCQGDSCIVQRDGIYSVNAEYSFTGGTNITYRLFFKINGIEDTRYQTQRKTSNADVGYCSVQGRYALNEGDTISLWVAASGASSFTPVWARFIIDQIR